jgi:predicted heme/steroid binding protein
MRNFTLEDLSRYNGKLLHCPAAAAAAAATTTRIQRRPRHTLGPRHTTARRLSSRTRMRSAGLNEIPEHHGRKSIYIAVSGVVFDMTSGGDFYGPGTLCRVLHCIPLMANTECNLSRLSSLSPLRSRHSVVGTTCCCCSSACDYLLTRAASHTILRWALRCVCWARRVAGPGDHEPGPAKGRVGRHLRSE